jgi:hypothetical protein
MQSKLPLHIKGEAKGMLLVVVNPIHVKESKKLDDNSPLKNERKMRVSLGN